MVPRTSFSRENAKGPILNRSLRLRQSQPRLPDEFQAQLDRAVRARPKDGIGRCLVGRIAAAPEGRWSGWIVETGARRSGGVVEIRVVEHIEELGAELSSEPFLDFLILDH